MLLKSFSLRDPAPPCKRDYLTSGLKCIVLDGRFPNGRNLCLVPAFKVSDTIVTEGESPSAYLRSFYEKM